MPLECLCRLVSAGVESRVAAATTAAMGKAGTSSAPGEEREQERRPGAGGEGGGGNHPKNDLAGEDAARVPAEKSLSPAAAAEARATMGDVMGSVSCPAVVLMAYVELLRTLASRFEKGDAGMAGGGGGRAAALDADAGEGRCSEAAGAGGAWAGVRAMDTGALFR